MCCLARSCHVGDHNVSAVMPLVPSRTGRRRIRQNLVLAVLSNGAAIPLAAAGVIPPSAAALAMLASSLSVMANAERPERGRRLARA